jgi:bacterioferritin
MKIEDFVEDLNLLLKTEYGAVLQYILHTHRLSKLGYKKQANELLNLGNDEIRHAEALAEKIKTIGGKPTAKAELIQRGDDIGKMLKVNLSTEKKSIQIYEDLIIIARKEGFKGLKKLLEEQLADELRHTAVLEKFLTEKYSKVK